MNQEEYINAKNSLLAEFAKLDAKYEFSKVMPDDYYEPGVMQNQDQFYGKYDEATGHILVRSISKGLRYENRSLSLSRLKVGDDVEVLRDTLNAYNYNNFAYFSAEGIELGYMDAALCNVIAPLYDARYLTIDTGRISYLEQLWERPRYAKQGVLFVEFELTLRAFDA